MVSPRFNRARTDDAAEPVVTILLKNLNQYRASFYELLRSELAAEGIRLRLVTASGMAEDEQKGDFVPLQWAEQRPFREIRLRGNSLLWQPGFDLARESDLIITEQASKQVFNVVLAYGQRLLGTRHAFWGHGRNFQASFEGDRGEGLKRALTRRAHWFFAYNDLSAEAARTAGMAGERITAVMNATDTRAIRAKISDLDAGTIRRRFGFGDGPLGLFMGGIYPPKRPEQLVASALAIRDRLPDFELVVIGDGSSRAVMEEAASSHEWIHWLGAMYGDERLEPASVCSLQLMPGLVGLNVVDAFALGLPTVTTDIEWHSPEIDYLIDGVNGTVVRDDLGADGFANAVALLLTDPQRLRAMQDAAWASGTELSIENMSRRFTEGVLQALDAPRR